MPRNKDKFYSVNGKRQILIADDEITNREMLGHVLQNEYDILFACDGAEALDLIRQNSDTLSLILLDIMMPVMSGLEVLKIVREDNTLSQIPVIVVTSETKAEVESLNLGAIDFIPKPYPPFGVIQARVHHAIELSEDHDIIQYAERDELTSLYNREFFYRYAEQYDQHHKDLVMDAIVLDINRFHMINERYGRSYGDKVLSGIGSKLREYVQRTGGIACRRDADTFILYCPHRDNYKQILDIAGMALAEDEISENRVRLRMGVYKSVDKTIDMERRFDRAKLAADTVKDSFTKTIGFYDEGMHEKQVFEEQLIEAFPTAIMENQFQVFYQPKFDVRPDVPVLSSAEALVRWIHPEMGMISPGQFIPLFEDNGLIQRLDLYVWRETARQIREWKDRLGYSVPVSVNMSRIDLYDPFLTGTMSSILNEFNLTGEDMLLEITESAYTQDHEQIIESVENLRKMGFRIEMDDFGTGYSSLNMISKLPIDALKLDMQFVREAFRPGGNPHMLEIIIGISKFLSVPVIAEGVETEEQLHALKELGCDLVQGYFFSKPVPASDYEPFILQKKEADLASSEKAESEKNELEKEVDEELAELQEAPEEFEDADRNELSEIDEYNPSEGEAEEPAAMTERKKGAGIQLKTASICFVIIAVLAAAALLISDLSVIKGYQRMEQAGDRYISAQAAASDMESGSDYLTDRVRCFVVTGDIQYLEDFNEEIEVTKRRDRAVEKMEKLMGDSSKEALKNLNKALELSNELVEVENYAMRLMLDTGNYDPADIPDDIEVVRLTPEDQALSDAEKKNKAQMLVFDNNYMHQKERIRENVSMCTQELIRSSSSELEKSSAELSVLVNVQTALTITLLLIALLIVLLITMMVRIPLTNMVKRMQEQKRVEPAGVEELRFVTRTYNGILRENEESREKLKHEASHDALTGLFNRGAYDLMMDSTDTEHMALILLDVDYFKEVNDTYGHAVGDRVLKRVADILRNSFRSVDVLCRIGGDEFAVIMTRVNSSMSQLVMNKVAHANEILQNPKDDLPPVSLSVGVAFSDRENPKGDIFKDADEALYRVKKAGRNGCEIY